MIDTYFHEYTGTGHELGGDTRLKPNPGWPYYEHSQSFAHTLEELYGIHTGDPFKPAERDFERTVMARYFTEFPGGWGGISAIDNPPDADSWGLL